jgi:hypothetical protein
MISIDFQHHYETVVAEYNREKDQLTIEKTFEALIRVGARTGSGRDRLVPLHLFGNGLPEGFGDG